MKCNGFDGIMHHFQKKVKMFKQIAIREKNELLKQLLK